MMDSQFFYQKVESSIIRLLAQCDRDVLSPSYGCFDHKYWHDRITDFPSGHDQEGVYALALLYSMEADFNPFYKKEYILELIKGAVTFWTKIQHSDGSIDEFYPYERQLGATAIVLWAVTESLLLLKESLEPEFIAQVTPYVLRSADFIMANDEDSDLTNHKSQACLALYNTWQLSGRDVYKTSAEKYAEKVKAMFCDEGWFKEYGGADAGYQTLTLSFMCRYLEKTGDKNLLDMLKLSVDFLSYAVFGGGYYGGHIYSRNTRHFWASGFVHLKNENLTAADILSGVLDEGDKNIFMPDHQDRYFVEQIYDFLYAAKLCQGNAIDGDSAKLPFKSENNVKIFDKCGLIFVKNSEFYAGISVSKGGCLTASDSRGEVYLDQGVRLKLVNGETESSFSFAEYKYEIENGDGVFKVTVSGDMKHKSYMLPTPVKFMMLRSLFLFSSIHKSVSALIKNLLIKLLITNNKSAKATFERVLTIDDENIFIDTDVKRPSWDDVSAVVTGAEFKDKFVAYSRSFSLAEMNQKIDMKSPKDAGLNGDKISVKRVIKSD